LKLLSTALSGLANAMNNEARIDALEKQISDIRHGTNISNSKMYLISPKDRNHMEVEK